MKKFCLPLLFLIITNYCNAFAKFHSELPPTATIIGTQTVCQNTAGVVITFTGLGGTAPYTFTYTINGGTPQTVTSIGNSVNVNVNTTIATILNYNLLSFHDATIPISEITQTDSKTITIKPQPDATINGTGSGTTFNGIPVFKLCNNTAQTFTFTNGSSTSISNTHYKIVWGDGSPDFDTTNWNTPITHPYTVGLWNLVYTIESNNSCPITKNYIVFVGSNPAVSLGNPGNTDICISSALTFPITGTANNPPGTTYTVTFNDGSTPEIFNHPPPASITHTFKATSCGVTSSNGTTSFQNSFSANIVAENPCGASAVGVVPIYVSTPPVADFNLPIKGCTNIPVCMSNTSTGASENNGSSSNCNTSPKFIWSISPSTGYTISSGSLGNDFGSTDPNLWTSGTTPLCIKFNQAGTFTITIKTGNRCGIDTETKTICIEPPLTPSFTLNTNSFCTTVPTSTTITNTTDLTNQCSVATYNWHVTYTAANCGSSISPIADQTTKDANFNFTEPGNYELALTMTNSCGSFVSKQTVTIKKPPTITAINGVLANYCGTATINPTATVNSCAPGSSTLNYKWSFPGGSPASSSAQNPSNIIYSTTGTYEISLVVSNECGDSTTFKDSLTVNEIPVLTTSPLAQTICSGTQTTAINLTSNVSGSTFTWTASATVGIMGYTPSGTTTTIPAQNITTSNTSVGTITYSITPKTTSCTGTPVNYSVTVNPAPTITTQPTSSTVCIGGAPTLLSVVLNSTSGTPTYQWYVNTVNSSIGGTLLPAQTKSTYNPPTATKGIYYYYCVITLSSAGCSSLISNIASVTVNPLPTIVTQPLQSQNICVGGTIPIPLSVTYKDGALTPSYQWYSNTTNSSTGGLAISGANLSTYTPPSFITAGNFYYYVVINFTGNGCGNLTSAVSEIVVANAPTVTNQPLPTQTLCQNAVPTDLTVAVTGGVGTYLYQWYSNSSNNTSGGTLISGATNDTYTPLTTNAGTLYYYCLITQTGFNCNVKSQISQVNVNIAPMIATQPVSNTICIGSTPTPLNVTYLNGVGAPSYQWYSNSTNTTIGGSIIATATSSSFSPPSNLAGTVYYYCTITFPSLIGGCNLITSTTAQVTINLNPIISPQTATICSTTSFLVTPANSSSDSVPSGTTYTWSTPVINPSGSITGATSQVVPQTSISQTLTNSTLAIGTAAYTVTPKSGSCVGATFTITVTVNPATNTKAVKTDSTCFGINNGNITTNSTGGIPFTNGLPYIISWTGPNSFTSSLPNINNLVPGTYNLTINDAGGCPISNSYTINEPPEIVLTTTINNNITCFGSNNGAIAISVIGGTGAYTYSWTKNGSSYATTAKISNLGPATYVVSVSDANLCSPKTRSFTITEPPPLSINLVNQINVECYGFATGAITINTTGGTPKQITPGVFDYGYSWTGPNGYTSTNQNISNLIAGTYQLTVTDNLGCSKNLTVVITQSTEIIINATTTPIVCYGDNNATINISISGGNAPYQVQWSNLAIGLYQDNLAPGNYTITVTDSKNCQKTAVITIPSPPIFAINPIVTNISCFGAHDGSIVLNFVGGIAPVKLVWSDGSTAGTSRNNLGAGTYSVVITDSKPCTITKTFTIIEPQPLVLSANTVDALDCNDANSGTVNLLVSGGTPPFNYAWNNGATSEDLNTIPAGNYAVTVTDSRGCAKTAQYTINRPNPLALSVKTTTTANCATHTVSQIFTAQPSGGVPPYQLNWSNGTVSGTNNELMTTTQNGLISVTATDAIGCKTIYSLNVAIPVLGNPSFTQNSIGYTSYGLYAILDPIQFNSTITGNYTSVLWDFGDGTFSNELNPSHTYLKTNDSYLVTQTVTYPFGCVYVMTQTLKVEKGYVLVVPVAFTPNNKDGVNDTFRPVTKGLKNIQLDIYDTWGSLIYSEVGNVIVGWNGKIKGINSENGNYYAKVSAETFYGTIVSENHPLLLFK